MNHLFSKTQTIILVLALISTIQPANAATGTPVALIDDATPVAGIWGEPQYPAVTAAIEQEMTIFTKYYHKKGVTLMPFDTRVQGGYAAHFTDRTCDGYFGVHVGTSACVSVNMCITQRPGNPLLCIEEVAIHEIGETAAGAEVFDPYEGNTVIVNGMAFPDFALPRKVQRQTGYKDYLKRFPY